jgi:hypothetical protein
MGARKRVGIGLSYRPARVQIFKRLWHRKQFQGINPASLCTVKRVDEVVRHPHLVTLDQNTQVSNKFFDIPVENFTINIELFRHFSQCRTSLTEQESVKSRKFYYKYRTFPTFLTVSN